jgi:hypothetical protein
MSGDQLEVARGRADPDDGADGVAERTRGDLGPEAEGATFGEPAEPLGHRGRGQPDPPAELGDPEPRIAVQLRDDPPVDLVEQIEGLASVVSLFRRHLSPCSAVLAFIPGVAPS